MVTQVLGYVGTMVTVPSLPSSSGKRCVTHELPSLELAQMTTLLWDTNEVNSAVSDDD